MNDVTPGDGSGQPAGPVSDRMQALLSRAVEEQATEQRAVSSLLADLRDQVAWLVEGVGAAASKAAVERLDGTVGTVVADLRTATSLLGQRMDVLSGRVDQLAADSAGPSPELTGLSDRLGMLPELRGRIDDLAVRTQASFEGLRPALDALGGRLDAAGPAFDGDRLRDSILDGLGSRLDRLESGARSGVTPEQLTGALGEVRAVLDGMMTARLAGLGATLRLVEGHLTDLAGRISDIGDAAGGVPALATDLARVAERVDGLTGLGRQVAAIGDGVRTLQDDEGANAVMLALAGLRGDVDTLTQRLAILPASASAHEVAVAVAERVGRPASADEVASLVAERIGRPPSGDELAALVAERVSRELTQSLAPRIARLVLDQVGDELSARLGADVAAHLREPIAKGVAAATTDSELRVIAHVDEAVLALAEALLRRRRGGKAAVASLVSEVGPATTPDLASDPSEDAPAVQSSEPVPMAPPASPPARPAVTTSMAPATGGSLDRRPSGRATTGRGDAMPAPGEVAAPMPVIEDVPTAAALATVEQATAPAPSEVVSAPVPTPQPAAAAAFEPAPLEPEPLPTPERGDGGAAVEPPRASRPPSAPRTSPRTKPVAQEAPVGPPSTAPAQPLPRSPEPPRPSPEPPRPAPQPAYSPVADEPTAKRRPWWRPGG